MHKTYFKQLNLRKSKHRSAFALVFVLLFATIALMVGTSIVVALISGMKLNRQSQQGTEAYYLARGGVDAAVNALRSSVDKNPVWPSSGCSSKFTIYYNNGSGYDYLEASGTVTEKALDGVVAWSNDSANAAAKKNGFFAARMCETGEEIESIGFFQGRKITLKAILKLKNIDSRNDGIYICDKISHDPTGTDPITGDTTYTDTPKRCGTAENLHLCSDDTNLPNLTDRNVTNTDCDWDHTGDLIKIYQTGS